MLTLHCLELGDSEPLGLLARLDDDRRGGQLVGRLAHLRLDVDPLGDGIGALPVCPRGGLQVGSAGVRPASATSMASSSAAASASCASTVSRAAARPRCGRRAPRARAPSRAGRWAAAAAASADAASRSDRSRSRRTWAASASARSACSRVSRSATSTVPPGWPCQRSQHAVSGGDLPGRRLHPTTGDVAACGRRDRAEQADEQVLPLAGVGVEQGGELALGQHHAAGELVEAEAQSASTASLSRARLRRPPPRRARGPPPWSTPRCGVRRTTRTGAWRTPPTVKSKAHPRLVAAQRDDRCHQRAVEAGHAAVEREHHGVDEARLARPGRPGEGEQLGVGEVDLGEAAERR